MWTICDMAMHLIYVKSTYYDTREFPLESRIPEMYFKPDEEFKIRPNTKIYLPSELYSNSGLPKKLSALGTVCI